jgi:hypothetical protein
MLLHTFNVISEIKDLSKITLFLGEFAKLREAIISFIMSVCPSVSPHGRSLLPLDEFKRNLFENS